MATTVQSIKKLGQVGVTRGINAADRRPVLGYVVQLTAPDENGGDIASAETTVDGGIPQPGSTNAEGLFVLRHSARKEGNSGQNWRVEVEYGFDASLSSGSVEPWLRDSTCAWGSTAHTVYRDKDLTAGTALPFKNSAHDRFDPPPPLTLYNPVCTVSKARRKSSWDAATIALLVGTSNTSALSIPTTHGTIVVAANKAVLRDIQQTEQIWTSGTHYYDIRFTFEIQVNYPVATVDVLDAGYHYIASSIKKLITVTDPTDGSAQRASSPQLLDGSGGILSVGGTPVYKTFVTATSASWAALLA